MPCVADDDSKAVRRITQSEQRLQEAKADLDRWLAPGGAPTTAAELAQRERERKALTDRLQALATAWEVQRALASPALHEQERMLAKASPKKMKNSGYRPVIDGTLQGPDEVFRLLEFYLRQLDIQHAKEVLFIADGARTGPVNGTTCSATRGRDA